MLRFIVKVSLLACTFLTSKENVSAESYTVGEVNYYEPYDLIYREIGEKSHYKMYFNKSYRSEDIAKVIESSVYWDTGKIVNGMQISYYRRGILDSCLSFEIKSGANEVDTLTVQWKYIYDGQKIRIVRAIAGDIDSSVLTFKDSLLTDRVIYTNKLLFSHTTFHYDERRRPIWIYTTDVKNVVLSNSKITYITSADFSHVMKDIIIASDNSQVHLSYDELGRLITRSDGKYYIAYEYAVCDDTVQQIFINSRTELLKSSALLCNFSQHTLFDSARFVETYRDYCASTEGGRVFSSRYYMRETYSYKNGLVSKREENNVKQDKLTWTKTTTFKYN